MAGTKFNYAELKMLDLLLGAVAFTPPGTLYVALYTVAPTNVGGGTEVSGGSYARSALTNNLTNFPAASGTTATKQNGTAITFPTATAAWGTVVAWAIFDAASAGNGLYWGTLTTSRAVAIGDTPSFAANALTITET